MTLPVSSSSEAFAAFRLGCWSAMRATLSFDVTELHDTIASASGGDRASLEILLERFLPDLRAFARLHMGPLAQQEASGDIVQSVCRQVLQDLDSVEYRGEAAFRRWLLVACTNRMRDHRKYWLRERRDARRETPITESVSDHIAQIQTPSGEFIKREELERLQAALDRMSDEHRQIVTCSRLLGMTHAEIAAQIGKSEGATRMLLHRALARLGLELASEESETA